VAVLFCVIGFASCASAQGGTSSQQSDAAKPQGTPATQPQPTPQQTKAAEGLPKKSNERSEKINERPVIEAPAPRAEPFDKATATEMSAQCVTLETESGAIMLEMLAEAAPESVRNFLNLAATGALDTTTFSRIVKGFVVQGGNLSTSEKWGAELSQRARRTIPDEPSFIKHVRGIVSMARPDKPDSATTHFFILVGEASQLDGKFAAFGRVLHGMDVVDALNAAPTEGEKPVNPVRLKRAIVAPCVK
jgi:cyclophilin family peptidyl-prolyl cis-trans isomerase